MNHFYSSDISDIEEHFKTKNGEPSTWICFGRIYDKYEKNKPFYIGYRLDKTITEKFIEDFNAHFTNIKMRLVTSNKYYTVSNSFSGVVIVPESLIKKYPEKNIRKPGHDFIVFTLDFAEEYKDIVKYAFYVIVGELLREYSKEYNWGFGKEVTEKYFENSIELSNLRGHVYGNCFYLPTRLDHVMLFDDIEKINSLLIENETVKAYHKNFWNRNWTISYKVSPYPSTTMMIIQRKLGELPEVSPEEINNPYATYKVEYFYRRPQRIYYRDENGKFCTRQEHERLVAEGRI